MSSSATNPTPPDDLDRLLSAYFTNELPHPWPACPSVSETASAKAVPSSHMTVAGPDAQSRSRLVLAASVAALMGLGLLASSGVQPHRATGKAVPSATAGTIYMSKTTADGTRHPMAKQGHPAP